MNHAGDDGLARGANGVLAPTALPAHRDDEYDPGSFDMLRGMQRRHFWYRGRHRFILHALRRVVRSVSRDRRQSLQGIDLGGGCGGWLAYLLARAPTLFTELALADSSPQALEHARDVLDANVKRYQVDLLNLPWAERWDVAFLLDVLEHIPDDAAVINQIGKSLRPGGYVLVTVPAFPAFWTYNDDLVHHVRRYVHRDFVRLAQASGLQLCRSRYFMFFLSPLLWLSRQRSPNVAAMTNEQVRAHLSRTHRVPREPINALLAFLFGLETPLGAWLPFPWGTSILGVFRKP